MLKAFIIISDIIPHVAGDLLLLARVCGCGCIVSRIIAAVTRLSPVSWSVSPPHNGWLLAAGHLLLSSDRRLLSLLSTVAGLGCSLTLVPTSPGSGQQST